MPETTATPENWAQIQAWVELGSVRDKCVYDLYQQVLELQTALDEVRMQYLRLANATAALAPDRTKFFAALHSDSNETPASEPWDLHVGGVR